MDEKLKNYLYNINEKNIAELGEMLADADAKLFESEKNKLTGMALDFTDEEKKMISELAIAQKKDEMEKYIKQVKENRMVSMKDFDNNIHDAKAKFRQIAITFDTVKLIVDNKNRN
jgi:hypothetical protein